MRLGSAPFTEAAELKAHLAEPRPRTKSTRQSVLSVLVVDNSPPMRAHLRSVLEQEPRLCLAGETDNGAEAVELFFRYRPEIVLLDVCLADRNAFEILQCFKQASPDCAVILLSDAPDPCVDEVSQMLGATEVCHKAGELHRMRDTLRRIARVHPPPPAKGL
jgi:DNA-binding NarL/FixJ family response regulator